jgi:hypothetical protein
LYNIFIEFGIPMKLVRLIRLYLTETYVYKRVRASKNLSDIYSITNGLEQRDVVLPLHFNLVVEYAIRRIQVNQGSLKLNGTHQLVVYVDYVNIF